MRIVDESRLTRARSTTRTISSTKRSSARRARPRRRAPMLRTALGPGTASRIDVRSPGHTHIGNRPIGRIEAFRHDHDGSDGHAPSAGARERASIKPSCPATGVREREE